MGLSIDREKVIDELNTDVLPFLQHHCDMQCDREKRWISKMIITVHNALALLKEQEAVEPILRHGEDGIVVWACGSCGAYMYHIYNGIDKAKEYAKYCRQCGRKVKWK